MKRVDDPEDDKTTAEALEDLRQAMSNLKLALIETPLGQLLTRTRNRFHNWLNDKLEKRDK